MDRHRVGIISEVVMNNQSESELKRCAKYR